MPSIIKEIPQGAQFSRSRESGQVADSQTRVFRIVLSQIGEVVDLQSACGVYIGDKHPYNANIYCTSFSGAFDGESRMVILATFQYGTTPAVDGDGSEDPPDVRPPNISYSPGLIEYPVDLWAELSGGNLGNYHRPINPAGDPYDGVVTLVPVTTITITQFEFSDLAVKNHHAGEVNDSTVAIGSLTCRPYTLMFRGVSCTPAVESYGSNLYRGYQCAFEFMYKQTDWSMKVPLSGFNVVCFNPTAPAANQDPWGQPLKHDLGKVVTNPGLALFDGLNVNDRARAMVKVFAYSNGGASQVPSAQPIPLNLDGTARKITPGVLPEGGSSQDPSSAGAVLTKDYLPYFTYVWNNLGVRLNP